MLFNSYEFILFFLPITLIVYFFLNKHGLIFASKAWLVVASLFFYSFWNIKYLPLILCSMVFNYSVGIILSRGKKLKLNRKLILSFGVMTNLLLLCYYKYFDFFISNINYVFQTEFNLLHIILPLGISFFTFTQIAYLVDTYKDEANETDFLNYALFVTFFPHLIAGPILHHKEMMPQFDEIRKKIFNYKNFSYGIFLFTIGLSKKVLIADTLSPVVSYGFDASSHLTFFEAWFISISYAFQLYFDFSGYTDMALGLGLMFNIVLPQNFNNPYISQNIQDFWRRWHMTLSRFLKNYIYIPLGGNKGRDLNTYKNLFLTFLIGGIWHGAAWTFVAWGSLHGIALIINRIWKKFNIKMHAFWAWLLTFSFVNICWVFFRAKSFGDAIKVIKGMFGFTGFGLPRFFHAEFDFGNYTARWNDILPILVFISFIAIYYLKDIDIFNNYFKPNRITAMFMVTFIIFILYKIAITTTSEFLYFDF